MLRDVARVGVHIGVPVCAVGKRTQCAKVVEKYHFESISVFQALKQEAEGDSD